MRISIALVLIVAVSVGNTGLNKKGKTMTDLISRKVLLAEYDRVHIGEPGKARKLIEDAPAVREWIPVSDRLPEDLPQKGGAWSEMVRPSVDVLVKVKGIKELYTAWYSYSDKCWTDTREVHSFTNVTHWMPLPEPPKGE
jgi:hypothetical protein